VKKHLGLDGEQSWIVLDEFNVFTWPGFDLRPITDRDGRVDYGFLPPKFFASLIEKIKELEEVGRVEQTSREE
jgi:hypothetical protein